MAGLDGYELVDAGSGRRLERFGDRLVDRPAPGAAAAPRDPGAWTSADLRFHRESGWSARSAALAPWSIAIHGVLLELRPTATGQVGLFPEHLASLDWLSSQLRDDDQRPAVLNLFAYTGLVTLGLARAGARVAHVDTSRPAVAWARRNAVASGLQEAPVRWLNEDAERFVARELRRGTEYDGVVLDPPTWGHATGGRAWRMDARLEALVDSAAALTRRTGFGLLTAHTAGLDPERLRSALAAGFQRPLADVELVALRLDARSGATLELGWAARVRRIERGP